MCDHITTGEEVIDIRIPDDLERLLSSEQVASAMRAATKAAAAEGQDRIAQYPGVRRKKQPFVSDKQRRAFFAKLKDGEIEVPYRRGSSPGSETLGRRWHIRPDGELSHILTNDASYAPLVHSESDQAAYHKGNWKTDEGLAKELRSDGTLDQIADQAFAGAYLGGIS